MLACVCVPRGSNGERVVVAVVRSSRLVCVGRPIVRTGQSTHRAPTAGGRAPGGSDGGGCMVKDDGRSSDRAAVGWRRATFIAGRSVEAGQRLLIATPDCKSTRRRRRRRPASMPPSVGRAACGGPGRRGCGRPPGRGLIAPAGPYRYRRRRLGTDECSCLWCGENSVQRSSETLLAGSLRHMLIRPHG